MRRATSCSGLAGGICGHTCGLSALVHFHTWTSPRPVLGWLPSPATGRQWRVALCPVAGEGCSVCRRVHNPASSMQPINGRAGLNVLACLMESRGAGGHWGNVTPLLGASTGSLQRPTPREPRRQELTLLDWPEAPFSRWGGGASQELWELW